MIAIRKADRLSRTEELVLEGFTKGQIAVRLGIGYGTVCNYVKAIADRRQKEDVWKHDDKRRELVAQQAEIMRKLNVAWYRSMQGEETVTTRYVSEKCGDCNGEGFREGEEEWCPRCGGDGEVLAEKVTRSVKGQCGDPVYMTAASACLKEIARLEGVPVKGEVGEAGEGKHLHLHLGEENPYLGVPSELLLEARSVLDRMKNTSDQTVIDVESKNGN